MEFETQIKEAIAALSARQADYQKFADYYEGRHALGFVLAKVRETFRSFFNDFRDNICPLVVDVLDDRLKLAHVGSGLDDFWRVNRLDALQGRVHREAMRSGDAYLLLWRDQVRDKFPRLYLQKGCLMTVIRDEDRPEELLAAVKIWRASVPGSERKRGRLNVFYADRVERFIALGETVSSLTDLEPFDLDGSPAVVPHSFGVVPVVAFPNLGEGSFGVSELRDVVPLQDALNKTLLDMLVGSESQALPQRYALGLEIERDEKGRPINPFEKAGGVWVLGNEKASLGQFDPANLSQMLAVVNDWRAAVARVSGVPLHYLSLGSGGWPTGEAMKTAEARLTAKVRAKQIDFGNAWEDVARLAQRMQGLSGDVESHWIDTTPRNEKEQVETAILLRQIGYSNEQLLRERGLSEEQIQAMQSS